MPEEGVSFGRVGPYWVQASKKGNGKGGWEKSANGGNKKGESGKKERPSRRSTNRKDRRGEERGDGIILSLIK